jgi:hypothetical protein
MDVWIFNLQTKEWKLVIPSVSVSLPSPRENHTAVIYNNFIVVFGGRNSGDLDPELWLFDMDFNADSRILQLRALDIWLCLEETMARDSKLSRTRIFSTLLSPSGSC